jgi:hypothetical protein
VAAVFAGAVVVYFAAFTVIEHLRTRKGGWAVTFRGDSSGAPSLSVSQSYLAISNVVFAFPNAQAGQSNFAQTVVFDQPITNIPFGRVIYLDTTFLPGSVVLDLFGEEIQLLPRRFLVNQREYRWKSETTLTLP